MQIISTISPAQFPSDSDMTRTTTVVPLRVLHQSTRKAVAEKKDSLIRNIDSIRNFENNSISSILTRRGGSTLLKKNSTKTPFRVIREDPRTMQKIEVIHSLPTAHTERSIILQPSSPYSSQTTSRQQILHSPSTDSATVYQTFQNSQHNGHWPTVFADVPNQFSYPRLTSIWNIISDNRKNIDLLSRYQGARTLEFPTAKPLMDHQVQNSPSYSPSFSKLHPQLEPWMLSPIRPGPIIPHNYIPNFTSKHPLHEESSHQHEAQVQITYLTSTTTPFLNIAEPDPVEQKNIHEFSHSSAVDGGNTAEIESRSPCFKRFRQRSLHGFEEETVGNIDLKTCLLSCLHGKRFFCASINYNYKNKVCTLNGGNLHLNHAVLVFSVSDYYENMCNPGEKEENGEETTMLPAVSVLLKQCFEPKLNNILLSLEGTIIKDATTMEKCVKECALSLTRRHRACGAVNWIPQANGCMLFEEGYDKSQILSFSKGHFYHNKCSAQKFETVKENEEEQKEDYYDDLEFVKRN